MTTLPLAYVNVLAALTRPKLRGFAAVRTGGSVYLDYQAATPVDPRVIATMAQVLIADFANPSSADHALGWKAHQTVERARAAVAEAFGASPEDITFTSGATEANNLAVIGAARAAPASRRRVIVSAIEHKSVLEAAASLREDGFEVVQLPVDASGRLDLAALQTVDGAEVAVISVMAVNNETGVIQPIEAVADWAERVGAFFHSDATQAPLALEIDLDGWGVHAASLSSHKLYGPKGVGALYLRADRPWSPKPLVFGGNQEEGLRAGTVPTALCAGFAHAAALLAEEGAAERTHVAGLREAFLEMLRTVDPDLRLVGAQAVRHPGNAQVLFSRSDAADLIGLMQPEVAASLGSACTSGQIGASHVLSAMGLSAAEAARVVRFSLGRFSDLSQLQDAAAHVGRAVAAQDAR